ncbi:uncharacterized protein [Aegilops tauschii subsp. strangulata]|uniref:uncharacterized protein isoform X2 n=1 Tax=Aegilops tauschii subsp. strangulata TaxID=200361 RepID=UPI001E1CA87C|nr:uncharacterized protein LOC120965459 [Aegilops tauschii subsp. strangulata]
MEKVDTTKVSHVSVSFPDPVPSLSSPVRSPNPAVRGNRCRDAAEDGGQGRGRAGARRGSASRRRRRPKMVLEGDVIPSEGEGSTNHSSRRNSKRPSSGSRVVLISTGRQRMMRSVINSTL